MIILSKANKGKIKKVLGVKTHNQKLSTKFYKTLEMYSSYMGIEYNVSENIPSGDFEWIDEIFQN